MIPLTLSQVIAANNKAKAETEALAKAAPPEKSRQAVLCGYVTGPDLAGDFKFHFNDRLRGISVLPITPKTSALQFVSDDSTEAPTVADVEALAKAANEKAVAAFQAAERDARRVNRSQSSQTVRC